MVDRVTSNVRLVDRGTAGRSRRRLAALAAATALTAAACGGGASAVDGASEAGAVPAADTGGEPTTEPQGEPSLLTGEFQTLAGTTFDLGSLQGEDVVLWFWAPW